MNAEQLSERDPRIDPKAGDVVENQDGNLFKVVKRDGDIVCYLDNGSDYEEIALDEWQLYAKSDKVLHAAR